MAKLTSPPPRRARLLLPILLMTAACGQEVRMQDPTAGQAGSAARSALLAPPPPAGDYRVRTAPTSLPESGHGPPVASSCSGGCPADSSVVDFELFTDPSVYHQLTTQYDSLGVVFDSTVVAVAPGYYYQNYPPRSGAAVATADFTLPGGGSGVLYFSFPAAEAVRVRVYVTSLSPITLRCFAAGGAELGATVFAGGNTVETQGGVPNQPVEVSAPGIRSCRLEGADNQYGIDDLTVVWGEGESAELTCDSVVRGQPGSCRVAGGATVLGWQFTGILGARLLGQDSVVVLTSASPDTVWSGLGVLSGEVSAFVQTGSAVDTLTADWTVLPRTGPAWRWSEVNWTLDEDVTPMCGFTPFVFPPTGPLAGVLARNRRISNCETGSIEPDPRVEPFSGASVDSVSLGPNAGLWYVTAVDFGIARGTEMNPHIRATDTTHALLDVDQRMSCNAKLGINGNPPLQVNLYTYNTICQSFDLTPMYSGLWAHEGYGTPPSDDPLLANGHEARRRIAARLPENDPRAIIEGYVGPGSRLGFLTLVQDSVRSADIRISQFSSDSTGFVKNNYLDPDGGCGKVWAFTKPPNPGSYSLYRIGLGLLNNELVCY